MWADFTENVCRFIYCFLLLLLLLTRLISKIYITYKSSLTMFWLPSHFLHNLVFVVLGEVVEEYYVTYIHAVIYWMNRFPSLWRKTWSVHQRKPRNLRWLLDGLHFITAVIHSSVNRFIFCFYDSYLLDRMTWDVHRAKREGKKTQRSEVSELCNCSCDSDRKTSEPKIVFFLFSQLFKSLEL